MKTTIWNEEIADHTARILFETGSYLVDFDRPKKDWFIWKSGIRAPVYCNCRYLNRSYQAYETCTSFFETIIRVEFTDVQLISGIASAGVSWAARIADRFNLPMSFVRTASKEYGIGKFVEGRPEHGLRAVIVDDLCGSGETILRAIQALEWEYQIITLGFITVSNWCFEHMWQKFNSMDIGIYSLTSYPNILKVGVELKRFSQEEADMLRDFYQAPWSYSWPLLKGGKDAKDLPTSTT